MPINNINTLQNYEDLKYTVELAKQDKNNNLDTDYYIHALANLEQRNEYRYSNGIKYGILTYDRDITVGINDANSNDHLANDEIAATTTLLELNNDMSFDIIVNNIETYLKHSQIYNDGNSIKSLLFGKILGSDDSESASNVEIQYTDIDLNEHILKEAYRAFHLNDPTNDNIYILIHLKLNETTLNEHIYKLMVYKLSIPINSENFKNVFKATTYAQNSISDVFGEKLTVGSTQLFDELISSCGVYTVETIENNYTLECTYDTVEEHLLKISDKSLMSDSYNKINELLYFNYYNISQYVNALNNDLTMTYPNILKYYSVKQFNSNNNTLKEMIAKTLYNEIYNGLTEIQKRSATLFIPKNTVITYVSNVENSLQIYYTDDIYIYFTNNSDVNIETNKNVEGIKFYYSGIDKTIIYNIYTKYNTKYTELVDCFKVNKKYVLPYIDDSHLWNINDNQTTIYASGESAGNPNIFIIRTYLDDKNNIKQAQLNRTDIQQNLLTYAYKRQNIRYYNSGTEATEDYTYIFAVPIINSKSIDKLKYATLFVMSNVVISGKDENNNVIYEPGPSVTTIWAINDNTTSNQSEFIIVTNDGTESGTPITFEDMFGIDELIYRRFVEYGHNANVFDDMIAIKLPKNIINGSEPKPNYNYFSIERNPILKIDGISETDESSYNYNLVEMKINDTLNYHDFSYATDTYYTGNRKLMNIWADNGRKVSQPYTVEYKNNVASETHILRAGALSSESTSAGITEQTVISSNDDPSIKTNENNTSVILNKIDINEYLPQSYVPILKESNIFHQDNNIINRTNIYSFNNSGDIYYAYIGTSCESGNKNVLHIGTSDFAHMVNLGKESLVTDDDSNNMFNKTDGLSIDFTYTYINSEVTNIEYLKTKYNISENEYTTSSDEHVKVITLPLYYIHNEYDNNAKNVIVSVMTETITGDDIFEITYRKENLQRDNQNPNNCHFIKIRLSNGNTDFGKYITNTYPELESMIGNLSGVQTVNSDEWINASGYYDNELKTLFFDSPLLVNIVNKDTSTSIYL